MGFNKIVQIVLILLALNYPEDTNGLTCRQKACSSCGDHLCKIEGVCGSCPHNSAYNCATETCDVIPFFSACKNNHTEPVLTCPKDFCDKNLTGECLKGDANIPEENFIQQNVTEKPVTNPDTPSTPYTPIQQTTPHSTISQFVVRLLEETTPWKPQTITPKDNTSVITNDPPILVAILVVIAIIVIVAVCFIIFLCRKCCRKGNTSSNRYAQRAPQNAPPVHLQNLNNAINNVQNADVALLQNPSDEEDVVNPGDGQNADVALLQNPSDEEDVVNPGDGQNTDVAQLQNPSDEDDVVNPGDAHGDAQNPDVAQLQNPSDEDDVVNPGDTHGDAQNPDVAQLQNPSDEDDAVNQELVPLETPRRSN